MAEKNSGSPASSLRRAPLSSSSMTVTHRKCFKSRVSYTTDVPSLSSIPPEAAITSSKRCDVECRFVKLPPGGGHEFAWCVAARRRRQILESLDWRIIDRRDPTRTAPRPSYCRNLRLRRPPTETRGSLTMHETARRHSTGDRCTDAVPVCRVVVSSSPPTYRTRSAIQHAQWNKSEKEVVVKVGRSVVAGS